MKMHILRRPIAIVLTLALLCTLVYIPQTNPVSATEKTVQELLGENWYVQWNGGVLSEGAYLSIVSGGAAGAQALRIGHPEQATNICLRYQLYKTDIGMAATDDFAIGMKFSAKIDGALASDTWIGVINPVQNPGGGNRSNLTAEDLASIGADWTCVDKTDEFYGVWCGAEYDRAELEFNIVLEAGNYFYLDDLQGYGFWGNTADKEYVNAVKNGSFEEGSPEQETTSPETTVETTTAETTSPDEPLTQWDEVQKELGENWYVQWNGGAAADADYVSIAEGGSHGSSSLRIGHPTERTDLCLRYRVYKSELGLADGEEAGIGMKFSGKLDGSFADGSWIGVINPVEPATGGNRSNLTEQELAAFGADWTCVDKTDEFYGVWCGPEYDRAELEFNIVLEAGNYFYLDDLQGYGFWGNMAEEMANVNVVHNGSFERWYCAWNGNSQSEESDFAQIVDGGCSGNALRLGNAEMDTDYTLQLKLSAPQAAGYSFDLWARTVGPVTDAAFELFDGTTAGARRRYSLNDVGTDWTHIRHTYDATDVWVNSTTLLVQIYVNLPAGSYLYLDDIHIAKENGVNCSRGDSNMLFDGGFEGYSLAFAAQPEQPEPPAPTALSWVGGHKRAQGWYVSWNEQDQYRSDYLTTHAYSGNYALALTALETKMGHTFATEIDGLEEGAAYVFEGYFKKKGDFSYASLMNGTTFLQLKDRQMEDWTLVTGSFTAGASNVLSIFTACPQGGYLLADDLRIYKAEDETKTNLLTNGDFEVTGASASDMLKLDKAFAAAPVAVEAKLRMASNAGGGVLLGNYDGKTGYDLGINDQGQPYVMAVTADGAVIEGVFTDVDVRTGEELSLLISNADGQLTCSVNGEVKQTLELTVPAWIENAFAIAGDHTAEGCFDGDLIRLSVSGETGLLGEWELEETATPRRITDSAQNGYDAVYYGEYFDTLTADTMEKYPYTFVAVGDTQYTNRGDTQTGNDYLGGLYQWIVDNQQTYNIQAVLGMGDIVDTSPSNEDEGAKTQSLKEWAHAVQAIGKLNAAAIPYTLVKGNHDSIPEYPENDTTVFENSLKQLGYDTRVQGWYEEGGSLANAYITLTVAQTDWLILTLDYNFSQEEIAWADSVIAAHPDHKVIINTHAYLSARGQWLESSDRCELTAEDLWNMLISKYENIELVLSGHIHSTNVVTRQLRGAEDNIVTEMLIDSQSDDRDQYLAAGNAPYAMATLLMFSADGNEIKVVNYATGKDKFFRADTIQTLDISDGQDIPGPDMTPPMTVPLEDVEIPGWTTRWSGNEAVNYRYLTTHSHSGSYALALTGGEDAMAYTYGQIVRGLEAGQEYTVEGYILYSGKFKMLDMMVGGNANKLSIKNFPEEQWNQITMTFTAQESAMALELFADARAGAIALWDDVRVYRTGDPEKKNLLENPGFEVIEQPQTKAPEKLFDYPADWELWAENEDASQVFVTDTAYDGKQAAAFVNTAKRAASLMQYITGLETGTYSLSAYVRCSGGQEDAALLAKGFDKENPDSQIGAKIQKCGIWTRVELEFEVTSGQAQVALWNAGNEGCWMIIDRVELVNKADATATNLLKNGSFEQAENALPPQQPVAVKLIDRDIPGWVEAWNENPGTTCRYLTTCANSGSYALALTSKKGNVGYTFVQRLDIKKGVSYTLEGYIYKSGELDAADILIGINGADGKLSFADRRMEGYEKFAMVFTGSTDYLEIGAFVSGPEGSLLMLDELTLYRTGDAKKKNLLTNGNFETLEAVQTQPPVAAEALPQGWDIWTDNNDPSTVYLTEAGRDGAYAVGMHSEDKQAASLSQQITGLEKGTYVLTVWVKSSGGQKDAAMLLKGFDKDSPASQTGVKIQKCGVWTQLRLEVQVTSGQVLVSFWNDANAGNWLMIDDVQLYRKGDPARTDLVTNGSFTDVLQPATGELPPEGDYEDLQPPAATEPEDAPAADTPQQPESNGWVIFVIGGVVLLAIAAAAAYILIKKKKQ